MKKVALTVVTYFVVIVLLIVGYFIRWTAYFCKNTYELTSCPVDMKTVAISIGVMMAVWVPLALRYGARRAIWETGYLLGFFLSYFAAQRWLYGDVEWVPYWLAGIAGWVAIHIRVTRRELVQ